jgi:hypothetical protein
MSHNPRHLSVVELDQFFSANVYSPKAWFTRFGDELQTIALKGEKFREQR